MPRTMIPFRDGALVPFEDLYKEMDQLLHQFWGQGEGRGQGPAQPMLTPINLVETEQGYEVTVDLPGVKAEDVHVEIHEGQLVVSGERKSEAKEEGKTFHRVERRYGTFRRVVSLPTTINEQAISAEYTDGVLKVHLPKSEKLKPTRIQVTPGKQA
ncbi:MAG: Hsp20/alpha crystallin family protein [Pirellulales bacterium]